MPRTYDDRRWTLNPDGSYSRKVQVEEVAEAPAEEDNNYFKDIETTGAAAQLADELSVDLSQVTGTGKGGRITKADVEAAAGG